MALAKLIGSILKSVSHQHQSKIFLTTTVRLQQNAEFSDTQGPSEPAEDLETAFPALETPRMTSRTLRFPVDHTYPRLSWVESMDTYEGTKLGMIDLHPDVFAIYPRIDVLHKNVHWQKMYRHIDYNFEPSRAEMPGGGRKPWPQKGTGRARHGSCRSPLWIQGAKAHGPRGPKSYFYMLSRYDRALGLRAALSCKYAQNDLVIVDSFDIPTSEPEYLQELTDVRFWGYSVLFVDDTDVMPENIAVSVSQIRGFNILPAYGLNVFSMLKHETLVLTLAALERIEGKLLDEVHTTHRQEKFVNTLRPEDFRKHPKQDTTMLKSFSAPIGNN
ncbi:unnamed protein product [Candidula unifasciata]|uniref:Large ribosomal subunit protein uL4m n=1 Tax=Candidula unifasciata TaxID=100452 RepID=A0A8S4A0Q2_9EUPU|nr:unnamed protein product [Candidula unifasciata]